MKNNIDNKQSKALTRRFFTGGIVLVLAAIIVPSVIYYNQFKEITSVQDDMLAQLKERVEVNVKTYMEQAPLSENDTTSDVESGIITKGNAQTKEGATASEISALITDDVIAQIESDVLADIYAKIETIISEKYSTELSPKELNAISNSVAALVTEDIYEFKKDVRIQLEGLDNFYATVNEFTGGMQKEVDNLNQQISTLESTYDDKFAALEESDANLQTQITAMRSAYDSLQAKQTGLEKKITAVENNTSAIQAELQKRIDSLQTSSETRDVELTNTLIKVQKDLSTQISTEDSKVYDNATRIIELTDKITNLDVGMADAIRVLNEQTGTDTAELYSTLAALQASLDAGDSDLSSAINTEMSERSKAISELLALIDSLSTNTSATQEDIYLEIERKSRNLASDLESTSNSMKNEYTTLIADTNANLTAYINTVKENLSNTIQTNAENTEKTFSETNKKIDDNNAALNNKISETNESLTNSLNSTTDELTNKINSTNESLTRSLNNTNDELTNKINSTNESLTKSISDTGTSLTSYIDSENLQTREDMAKAIETLQKEIEELQAEIDELKQDKLNVSDSTRYNYSTTDGNTIRITVPSTNPNYTR